MTDHSTEHSAGTGRQPPAVQSSPEQAFCRSPLQEISAGCPEEQQQSNISGSASKLMRHEAETKKRLKLPTVGLEAATHW